VALICTTPSGSSDLANKFFYRRFAMSNVVPLPQGECWAAELSLNSRGVPLGNLCNVLHTLRHAVEWQNVLAYDEFAAQVVA
jgi:hypothetical protein